MSAVDNMIDDPTLFDEDATPELESENTQESPQPDYLWSYMTVDLDQKRQIIINKINAAEQELFLQEVDRLLAAKLQDEETLKAKTELIIGTYAPVITNLRNLLEELS